MIDPNNRFKWDNNSAQWDSNTYVWSDIELVISLANATGGAVSQYKSLRTEQKKRIIKLICNIKGMIYSEEKFKQMDSSISIKDIRLLVNDMKNHIKLDINV